MATPTDDCLSEDRLLGGRVRFLQPRRGYRVAIDPVLLAAAVPAATGHLVLDAGSGTGAAALCLATRIPGARVVGLERNAELLAVGRQNVALNAMAERVELLAGDVLDPGGTLRDRAPFDHVMTNPPYHRRTAATSPRTATGAAAHLADGDPAAWIEACLAWLRPRGWLTLIHRAEALTELLAALAGRAGDVVVYPFWPNVDAPTAKRVIVAARKGGRGPTRLDRGLVLHAPDGRFTEAAEAVLRDAAPLPLRPA
jgi:tRNA1(Val) A37 N6-methylase TrmN6